MKQSKSAASCGGEKLVATTSTTEGEGEQRAAATLGPLVARPAAGHAAPSAAQKLTKLAPAERRERQLPRHA